MKFFRLSNMLIALALLANFNFTNAIYPPENDRFQALAKDPTDPAYLPYTDKRPYWDDLLKTDTDKAAAIAAKKPLPGGPPPPRKPSYENNDGMGAASNGHIGMSQADARRVAKGDDGKLLPDGPSGTPVDAADFDTINKEAGSRIDEKYPQWEWDDAVDTGGVQGRVEALNNAGKGEAAPSRPDGKPQSGDSVPARPKDLKPGQGPSVKDQIDKFNANDSPPSDTRPLNRPTNPLRSDPVPAADHPISRPYEEDGVPKDFETALHAAQDARIADAKKHRDEVQHGKHPDVLKPGSPHNAALDPLSEKLSSIREKENKIANEILREQGERIWRKSKEDASSGDLISDETIMQQLGIAEADEGRLRELAEGVMGEVEALEALHGLARGSDERVKIENELKRISEDDVLFSAESKRMHDRIREVEKHRKGKGHEKHETPKNEPPHKDEPSKNDKGKQPEKHLGPNKDNGKKPNKGKQPEKPYHSTEVNNPPVPVPDYQLAKNALSKLSQTGKMTDEIASELVASNFAMHPSAQKSVEAMGREFSKDTAAQSIISGMAALPFIPEAASVLSASPEMLEIATLAGSPEVLAAAGIKTSAPAIAEAAKAVSPLVHGVGGLATAGAEEVVEAAVVSAQVAGVLGKSGVDILVSGSTAAAKASGKVLAGALGAGGLVLGAGLGFVGGLVGAKKHHKDKTMTAVSTHTATKIRTHIETSIVEHISTIMEGRTSVIPGKTVLVTVTATPKTTESRPTILVVTPVPTPHSSKNGATLRIKSSKTRPTIPVVTQSPTSKTTTSRRTRSCTTKPMPTIPVVTQSPTSLKTTPRRTSSSISEAKPRIAVITPFPTILSNGNGTSYTSSSIAKSTPTVKKPVAVPFSTIDIRKNEINSIQTSSSVARTQPTIPVIQPFPTIVSNKNGTSSHSGNNNMTERENASSSTMVRSNGTEKTSRLPKTSQTKLPSTTIAILLPAPKFDNTTSSLNSTKSRTSLKSSPSNPKTSSMLPLKTVGIQPPVPSIANSTFSINLTSIARTSLSKLPPHTVGTIVLVPTLVNSTSGPNYNSTTLVTSKASPSTSKTSSATLPSRTTGIFDPVPTLANRPSSLNTTDGISIGSKVSIPSRTLKTETVASMPTTLVQPIIVQSSSMNDTRPLRVSNTNSTLLPSTVVQPSSATYPELTPALKDGLMTSGVRIVATTSGLGNMTKSVPKTSSPPQITQLVPDNEVETASPMLTWSRRPANITVSIPKTSESPSELHITTLITVATKAPAPKIPESISTRSGSFSSAQTSKSNPFEGIRYLNGTRNHPRRFVL